MGPYTQVRPDISTVLIIVGTMLTTICKYMKTMKKMKELKIGIASLVAFGQKFNYDRYGCSQTPILSKETSINYVQSKA